MTTRTQAQASLDRTARRAATIALAGCGGFALGYMLVPIFHVPTIIYQPLQRAVLFASSAPKPAMMYYGQLSCGVAVGIAGAIAAAIISRSRAPGERAIRLLFGAAAFLITLDVAYFVWEFLRGTGYVD